MIKIRTLDGRDYDVDAQEAQRKAGWIQCRGKDGKLMAEFAEDRVESITYSTKEDE